ncbi:hypothetical protein [Kitasatospora viridis]|uniref:Uncharacterized protein n=1 Tax=Kitasatospora viridis TaxID=281105 RepID=A0A561S9Z7_9ACTN|nr:hypothetical protein [Kitasatospora viridis]TWF71667.1 hypothetical protein FHX73_1838 [Kitasatospora viridis]
MPQPQALIRTYVPVAVGSAVTALADIGVNVDSTSKAALITGLTGVVIAAYYTLVHLLESRWPAFSVLLGSTSQPTYTKTTPPSPSTTAEPSGDPTPGGLG